jgi:aminoglycoside 6'-N-acetyltransferase
MPSPAVDWNERRRLQRELAVCGDPAGAAEEAPQSPRGKRSLSWKSTASSTINTKLFYKQQTLRKQPNNKLFMLGGIILLFQKGKLIVRKLKVEDCHSLARWLSDPRILEFYVGRDNPFDLQKVQDKFFDRDNNVERCIIVYDGEDIGYIQYYQLDKETSELYGYEDRETIYGTDQFIGEVEYWNKGIGQVLVKEMTEFLVNHKRANKVVMDPRIENERAIKCYEKSGFQKVKLLPKRELHEGEYRDCWLMEYHNNR